MLCCIAVAFVIAVAREGWRSLTFAGDTDPAAPLPPPAMRSQPGDAPAPAAAAPYRSRSRWDSDVLTRARVGLELRFAAAGIVLYIGAVALLLAIGAADGAAGAAAWVGRDGLFATLALIALVVARSWVGSGPLPMGRERLACALMGGGAVWLELGILDQHFFGLFSIASGALGWDVLFHGVGAAAFAAGWALLVLDTGGGRQTWRREPSPVS